MKKSEKNAFLQDLQAVLSKHGMTLCCSHHRGLFCRKYNDASQCVSFRTSEVGADDVAAFIDFDKRSQKPAPQLCECCQLNPACDDGVCTVCAATSPFGV
jgi:hypothetical protein